MTTQQYALKLVYNMGVESDLVRLGHFTAEWGFYYPVLPSHPNLNKFIGELVAVPTQEMFAHLLPDMQELGQ
jgi:hypothetical protein